MTDAGLKSKDFAKEKGSWTILYTVENLEVPFELEKEFKRNKKAKEYFENLSKSSKKTLLNWINSAKKDETRTKRIVDIVKNKITL